MGFFGGRRPAKVPALPRAALFTLSMPRFFSGDRWAPGHRRLDIALLLVVGSPPTLLLPPAIEPFGCWLVDWVCACWATHSLAQSSSSSRSSSQPCKKPAMAMERQGVSGGDLGLNLKPHQAILNSMSRRKPAPAKKCNKQSNDKSSSTIFLLTARLQNLLQLPASALPANDSARLSHAPSLQTK